MDYPVKVLGFGDNVVDLYDHLHLMYPGGNAVNFAVFAKRLGVERSAYMGIFGTDRAAEHVISSLEKEQVELVKCLQIPGENGWSRNTVVDGDRVFLDYNNGGIRGDVRYPLGRFELAYAKQFDLVHTGIYCFTERELPKLQKAGVPVSFDFSDEYTEEDVKEIAPYVTYAFFSCGEETPQEKVWERLLTTAELGPKIVCASRGAKGCIAYAGGEFFVQQAVPVQHMADTMGAGDALLTAFLVGYLSRKKKGMEEHAAVKDSLADAAQFASQVCGIDGAWGYGVHYE